MIRVGMGSEFPGSSHVSIRVICLCENPCEKIFRKRPVNPTFSHPSVHGMLITDIQVL